MYKWKQAAFPNQFKYYSWFVSSVYVPGITQNILQRWAHLTLHQQWVLLLFLLYRWGNRLVCVCVCCFKCLACAHRSTNWTRLELNPSVSESWRLGPASPSTTLSLTSYLFAELVSRLPLTTSPLLQGDLMLTLSVYLFVCFFFNEHLKEYFYWLLTMCQIFC